jgi:cell division protein FtsI/penicillin-binding protein 2
MKGEYSRRYAFITFAFATVAVAIVFQIIRLQISPEAKLLRERGDYYTQELHLFFPARGDVTDRWGHLLAGNQTVYEIGVDLYTRRRNPETIAFTLSRVLAHRSEYGRPDYYDQVFRAASTEPNTRTVYIVVADYVSQEDVDQIKQMALEFEDLYEDRPNDANRPTLNGLVIRPHLMRVYPENDLGAGILGFVNRQGEGFFGVEARYNNLLAGEPQLMALPTDPIRAQELPSVPDGATLILTLDRDIQSMLQQVLDNAIAANGAAGGTIVVLDPQSGEILGMATTPRLNINEYWRYSEIFEGNTPFNSAVSRDYEPGSVFKVLTMAAALDAGAVTPETTFYDNGVFAIGGHYIYNWNYGAWGEQTMTGCLQHSLNVCLAWVATQLGNDAFYSYMQKFGIGRLTGIDLDGEVPGRLKVPGDGDWYEVDLGTNSFGQGVAVTPLQMAAAIAAVANQGEMMAPRIVRAYVDKGQQFDLPARTLGRPISPETAKTLSEMLAVSLEDESSDALVEGYRIAGKTGTASIATATGEYDAEWTNASFVGWGPVDDPHFLVYVWIEKPSSSPWGSVVAAPVFQEVVQNLVVLLKLPPDNIRLQLANGQ